MSAQAKHWGTFTGVLALLGSAIILSEKRRAEAPVSPQAVLYFVADTERELSHLPTVFTPLSDAEEIKIGDEWARIYLQGNHSSTSDAEALETYISQVGARMAAHAHRKLPYRFHYVPNMDFVNAFALPGGHVFIGAGMLSLMDSEDELAGVLGHEIEHIDHYHCAERAQVEAALRKIPLGELVYIPVAVFEAGYSKDQELEADREGTRLAVTAGYSPLGVIRLYETFERLNREDSRKAATPAEEISDVARQTMEGYFRSHPPSSERIAQIRKLIASENWGALTSERPLAVAYVFWTERARRMLERRRYDQAALLAAHSLELQADQSGALEVLAQAEFQMAEFDRAASAYRKRLDLKPRDVTLIGRYAWSLAATGRYEDAAEKLRVWTKAAWGSSGWLDPDQATTEGRTAAEVPTGEVELRMEANLDGLLLLAGRGDPATALVQRLHALPSDWSVDRMGEIADWYYKAGSYDRAAELLAEANQERPGNQAFQTSLGWALIEQHKYTSALEHFSQVAIQGNRSAAEMGLAVASWQGYQREEALGHYSSVVIREPSWLNERWVKALYAPSVWTSIAEMGALEQRRQAQAAAHSAR